MTETTWIVHIDPAAVATDRYELDLNSGSIQVDQQGIDWGDAQITAYMAEQQTWGSNVVSFRVPNRQVKIPLAFGMDATADGETGRAQLQQKVALLQREGGWLLRQRDGGNPLYADIVNATLSVPDKWLETGGIEPDIVLNLECLPDFYGDLISLDSISVSDEQGYCEAVLQLDGENAIIEGDHPGRVTITVTDESGYNQAGLLWGFRCMNYSSEDTAALVIEAESTVVTDFGSVVDDDTASNGEAVSATYIEPFWSTMTQLELSADDGTALTHAGVYEVWVRVKATAISNYGFQLRLLWALGGTIAPVANNAVDIPYVTFSEADKWYLVNLGQIRITQPPIGDLSWYGQLQLRQSTTVVPLSDVSVVADVFYFVPLDESAGQLTYNPLPENLTNILIYDTFTGSGDPTGLAGTCSDIGGAWSDGAGPSEDYYILVPGTAGGIGIARRATDTDDCYDACCCSCGYNDSVFSNGRIDVAGSDAPNVVVSTYISPAWFSRSADEAVSPGSFDFRFLSGIVARFRKVSSNLYFVGAGFQNTGVGPTGLESWQLVIWKVVDNTVTVLYGASPGGAGYEAPQIPPMINGQAGGPDAALDTGHGVPIDPTQLTMRIAQNGVLQVLLNGTLVVTISDPDFLAGGALDTGTVGLYDFGGATGTYDYDWYRFWQQFLAIELIPDAVIFADSNLVLSTQGMYKEQTTYSPVANVIGDLPRIPPSGLENRPVQLFLRPSQGDLDQAQDTALSSFSVQVNYRPSWLFRP